MLVRPWTVCDAVPGESAMAETGLRTNHQSRVDWWRRQFERQQKANLSVTELCRQLDVSVTTFYYWRKRVLENSPTSPGQVAAGCPPRRVNYHREFCPYLDRQAHHGARELEIELNNSLHAAAQGHH